MTIDQLTAAGQLLYGDQWQANLARSSMLMLDALDTGQQALAIYLILWIKR